MRAFLHDLRLGQGELVVASRDVVDSRAVEDLRLEVDNRILVANGAQEQTLGLIRSTGNHNLHTRRIGKVKRKKDDKEKEREKGKR